VTAKRRVCGNCGNTQSPFDRLFIGNRKTGHWIFTCPVPLKDAEGKRLPDKKRADIAAACTNRREKQNASAQAHHAQGS